jgi:hypothetical protein
MFEDARWIIISCAFVIIENPSILNVTKNEKDTPLLRMAFVAD